MALVASDQLGGIPNELLGVEFQAWSALASTLNLVDTFDWHRDTLSFTCDNHKMNTNAA